MSLFRFFSSERRPVFLFILIGLIFATTFLVIGCQQKEAEKKAEEKTEVEEEQLLPVSLDEPMKVDKANKTVYVYAEVNGKYLYEPTRHGVVFKDGTNGDKSIFKAYAKALDLWEALTEIDAKPGNNVTKDSPEGTIVEGDVLDVKVTWEGADKEYSLDELITSDPDRGFEIRFGGNKEFQGKVNTGCLLCLDSCAAGITSNANWGWKSFEGGKVKFIGKPEMLKDGQSVVVIFRLK